MAQKRSSLPRDIFDLNLKTPKKKLNSMGGPEMFQAKKVPSQLVSSLSLLQIFCCGPKMQIQPFKRMALRKFIA